MFYVTAQFSHVSSLFIFFKTVLFYGFKTIRFPNLRIYIKPNDNGNTERGGYR